jgi:hypothetical protein
LGQVAEIQRAQKAVPELSKKTRFEEGKKAVQRSAGWQRTIFMMEVLLGFPRQQTSMSWGAAASSKMRRHLRMEAAMQEEVGLVVEATAARSSHVPSSVQRRLVSFPRLVQFH